MKTDMTEVILIAATTLSGLVAGLLYSYACSVNIGLGRLPDREYLSAMQAINTAIQNPVFFISFMGTLLLLPLSAYLNYKPAFNPRFMFLLIAAIIYVVGVFGVTAAGNIPLNNTLAAFNINAATAKEIAAQRLAFEKPWGVLHNIRTAAAVVSFVLVIISLFCERDIKTL